MIRPYDLCVSIVTCDVRSVTVATSSCYLSHHSASIMNVCTGPVSLFVLDGREGCSSLKGLEIAGIKAGHTGIKAVNEGAVRPCGLL
jgi:hypothetical protein